MIIFLSILSRCLATLTCLCGRSMLGLCTKRLAGTPGNFHPNLDQEGTRSLRQSNIQIHTKTQYKTQKTCTCHIQKITLKCTHAHTYTYTHIHIQKVCVHVKYTWRNEEILTHKHTHTNTL